MTLAFEVRGMGLSMAGHELLSDVSVTIGSGRWTAIVGPNGAGKSTFLRALAGLQPVSGTVKLMGRPLQQWGRVERAQTVAWLGQNEPVSDDLHVEDLVMLGRLPHQNWFALPTDKDHLVVDEALRAMGVSHLKGRAVGTLSGGERQRVLMARALAVQSAVLLLDEPLANLDPPHQADWLLLVRALVVQGKTVVSVLHEVSAALQADDLMVLDRGSMVHHGSAGTAATHRAVEQVFSNRIAIHPLAGQWVGVTR
ncbi:MAG: hypothetical protein RI959_1518 [Pseudomonadota bacterium]